MDQTAEGGASDATAITASLASPERFSTVIERHFAEIHRYLTKRVGAEADDLAADTFVTAFRNRHRYDPDRESARPWLYGIATNVVRHHRRTEGRRLASLARLRSAMDASLDDTALTVERLDARIELGRLTRAFAALDPDQRDALYLIAVAGLSYDEVADALGLPVGTVHSRVARARERLRDPGRPSGQKENMRCRPSKADRS